MELGYFATVGLLIIVFASFTLSASVGLGGSLILVPGLAMMLGTKEGVAVAALLLGANNTFKVFAYRRSLPFKAAALIVVLLTVGAVLGASALVRAPDWAVGVAVISSIAFTLVAERRDWNDAKRAAAPALALAAGATSGFSGTSGPLKGVALRSLSLERLHFVGGASLASLAGDLGKTAVFAEASLLGADALRLCAASVPLMLIGTNFGRRINRSVGESGFAVMFWSVMGGYSIRVATVLL